MNTLAEIEAAVPHLSIEELAKLERVIRAQRKAQAQPVSKRAPKAKAALSLDRTDLKGWRAEIATRNWRT
jgi:hypothetical protein